MEKASNISPDSKTEAGRHSFSASQAAEGECPQPLQISPVEGEKQAACAPEKAKKRTIGNVLYDFGVFGSIAWGGVSTMSVLTGHEANYGTNKYFGWLRSLNQSVTSGSEKVFSKILTSAKPETIRGYARGTAMFVILGAGGSALMAPIKWLEDNRKKNAARIDQALGTTPPDQASVQEEPKQTWKSVFAGRAVSWITGYSAFLAMGPKLVGKIEHCFGEMGSKQWMKWKPHSDPQKVSKWSDIIVFDVLFTMVTASITYAYSRYIAKKNHQKLDAQDELYELSPATPNPLGEEYEKEPENAKKFITSIETERGDKAYEKSKKEAPKPRSSSFIHQLQAEPVATQGYAYS